MKSYLCHKGYRWFGWAVTLSAVMSFGCSRATPRAPVPEDPPAAPTAPAQPKDKEPGPVNHPSAADSPPILTGHASHVNSVAFSPDRKWIASGSWDSTVKVWDAQTGVKHLDLRKHTAGILSVAFSPDSKRIASGSWDKTVAVWDAQTGDVISTLRGHTLPVLSVAFSPDGQTLVSGSGDFGHPKKRGEVKVWDVQSTGKEVRSLDGHQTLVTSVAYSHNGQQIATAGADGWVNVWKMQGGKDAPLKFEASAGSVHSVAFSPDGRHLVTGIGFYKQPHLPGQVIVWDAKTGRRVRTIFLKDRLAGYVSSVAYSPDGRHIISGSGVSQDEAAPGEVNVWDAQTGDLRRSFEGHKDYVTSVAVSSDGRHIVSGSRDGTARVWAGPIAQPQNPQRLPPQRDLTAQPQNPQQVPPQKDLKELPVPVPAYQDYFPGTELFVGGAPPYAINPKKGKEIATPAGTFRETVFGITQVNLNLPGWRYVPSVEFAVATLDSSPADPARFLTGLLTTVAGGQAKVVRQYRHLGYPAVRFSTDSGKGGYVQHHLFVLDGSRLYRVEASNPAGVTMADADRIRDSFQPLRERARKTPGGWVEYVVSTTQPDPYADLPNDHRLKAGFERRMAAERERQARLPAAEQERLKKEAAERAAKARVIIAFPTKPEVVVGAGKSEPKAAGVEWKATATCRRGADVFVLRHGPWRTTDKPNRIPRAEELVDPLFGRQAAVQAAGPRGTIDLFRRSLLVRVDPTDKQAARAMFEKWVDPDSKGRGIFGREYQATREDGSVVRGVVYARNGVVLHLEHRGPTVSDAQAFFDSVR